MNDIEHLKDEEIFNSDDLIQENPESEQANSLNFTDEERDQILKRIKGDHPEATLDTIPTDEEGIIYLMSTNPQYFESKHIEYASVLDSERSMVLIGELARRAQFNRVFRVLKQYINKPQFEWCVKAVEQKVSEKILSTFAHKLQETVAEIADVSSEMKSRKKTARPLSDYDTFFHTSHETHMNLKGKQLLLIGGGNSPIKADLALEGIDTHVVNVDPLADPSNHANADEPIRGDFFKTPLGKQKFQEIWASHSLPMYAFDRKQVLDFYKRALDLIEHGGVLRIMPIDGFSDALTPGMRLTRRSANLASIECVEALRKRPDLFQVETTSVRHKGAFGKMSTERGVNIRIVGNEHAVCDYLNAALAA